MKVNVSWYRSDLGTRQHTSVEVPNGVRVQSIKTEIEIEPDVRHADEFDVVRVKFDPTGREYCYRYDADTGGIQPGDYVLAPANSFCPHPQVVRVVGFGRNDYRGSIHSRVTPLPATA
jgi:hypothetical protein